MKLGVALVVVASVAGNVWPGRGLSKHHFFRVFMALISAGDPAGDRGFASPGASYTQVSLVRGGDTLTRPRGASKIGTVDPGRIKAGGAQRLWVQR